VAANADAVPVMEATTNAAAARSIVCDFISTLSAESPVAASCGYLWRRTTSKAHGRESRNCRNFIMLREFYEVIYLVNIAVQ
jgi:hypothetical protein